MITLEMVTTVVQTCPIATHMNNIAVHMNTITMDTFIITVGMYTIAVHFSYTFAENLCPISVIVGEYFLKKFILSQKIGPFLMFCRAVLKFSVS